MKKLLLILGVLFIFSSFFNVNARDNSHDKRVVIVEEDKTIDDDYFAAGDMIEINGIINGDAYIAGGQVIINGTINGDLIAAGGSVNIMGEVGQDVRVAGGQIIISGQVNGNLTAVGGEVVLVDTAAVGKSLVLVSGSARVNSPINGSLRAITGNMTLGSRVGGKTEVYVGELRLSSGANIESDLTYWSDKDAIISSDSTVSGGLNRNEPVVSMDTDPKSIGRKMGSFFAGIALGMKIAWFVSTLVVGILFIRFLPRFAKTTVSIMMKSTARSFVLGFIALFLVPILFIILLISLLGIPLAFFMIGIYMLAVFLSAVPVSLWLGSTVLGKKNLEKRDFWDLAVGLVIYTLAVVLPFIGGFIQMIAISFGLGSLLMAVSESYGRIVEKKLV